MPRRSPDQQQRKPSPLAPAWSTPPPRGARSWLRREVLNALAALVALALLAVVLIGSIVLANAWPMAVIGVLGTACLWRHRRAGSPWKHALWVISVVLLLTAGATGLFLVAT